MWKLRGGASKLAVRAGLSEEMTSELSSEGRAETETLKAEHAWLAKHGQCVENLANVLTLG